MLRHDLDELTSDAMRLMQMEINDLYATLGGQLLGHNLPRRAAVMVSYLSGKIGLTAESCGIGLRTLSRKMHTYGLDKRNFCRKALTPTSSRKIKSMD